MNNKGLKKTKYIDDINKKYGKYSKKDHIRSVTH